MTSGGNIKMTDILDISNQLLRISNALSEFIKISNGQEKIFEDDRIQRVKK